MLTSLINALAFPISPPSDRAVRELRADNRLTWLTTESGHKLPALLHRRQQMGSAAKPGSRRGGSQPRRFLVLYSHGNAEDLTQLRQLVAFMAHHLDADVLAYDYPGYSIASGSPSEAGLYAAAAAAYAWAVRPASEGGGGAAPSDIVPFGRSLGSAAAVYMASVAPTPCGGLILQSPLMSGASAFLGEAVATLGSCVDPFRNSARISSVRCRVAICHGESDRVVPCWNGRALHDKAPETSEPLWLAGRGHNDMDEEQVLVWAAAFLDGQAREAVLAEAVGAKAAQHVVLKSDGTSDVAYRLSTYGIRGLL